MSISALGKKNVCRYFTWSHITTIQPLSIFNKIWQLLIPLHLIFCAASLCKHNSNKSPSIMPYEIRAIWDLSSIQNLSRSSRVFPTRFQTHLFSFTTSGFRSEDSHSKPAFCGNFSFYKKRPLCPRGQMLEHLKLIYMCLHLYAF